MDSTPPYPIGPGQRTLAAIVFTDVVSFSRRVQREEVGTLELLEKDFTIMRRLCEKHAGTVLKSTGDGLLLYFTSAVQAVGCALQVQQQFAARARENPTEENLVHRVGIHLGDVFVNNQDVMGDGVNIASRLQGEADPGGICISQTVYDVVKNKLELTVVRMTARGLKNIAESGAIYRVLLEPDAIKPAAPAPVYVPAPRPPARSTGSRKLAVTGLVLLGVAGLGGLAWHAQQDHEEELARSRATQAELGALLAAKGSNPLGSQASAEVRPEAVATPEQIPELMKWVAEQLPRYTRDAPLRLQALPGEVSRDTKLFMDAAGRLCFAEGGAIRQRNLPDLKPEVLGAVIVSVLNDIPAPPAGMRLGAEAFAARHGLKEMTELLRAAGR